LFTGKTNLLKSAGFTILDASDPAEVANFCVKSLVTLNLSICSNFAVFLNKVTFLGFSYDAT